MSLSVPLPADSLLCGTFSHLRYPAIPLLGRRTPQKPSFSWGSPVSRPLSGTGLASGFPFLLFFFLFFYCILSYFIFRAPFHLHILDLPGAFPSPPLLLSPFPLPRSRGFLAFSSPPSLAHCTTPSLSSPRSFPLRTVSPTTATFPTRALRAPSFAQLTPSLLPFPDNNAHFLGSCPLFSRWRPLTVAPNTSIYVYFSTLSLFLRTRSRSRSRRRFHAPAALYDPPLPLPSLRLAFAHSLSLQG